MKIFTEETGGKKPGTFIIIMDKREAKTLFEIVETAHKANCLLYTSPSPRD